MGTAFILSERWIQGKLYINYETYVLLWPMSKVVQSKGNYIFVQILPSTFCSNHLGWTVICAVTCLCYGNRLRELMPAVRGAFENTDDSALKKKRRIR